MGAAKSRGGNNLHVSDLYYYGFSGAMWGFVAFVWINEATLLARGAGLSAATFLAPTVATVVGLFGHKVSMSELSTRLRLRRAPDTESKR